MFYLIGLGLGLESISVEGIETCLRADKIYLEHYTVGFPYDIHKFEDILKIKVIPLSRTMVEKEDFLEEAKKKDIVLLVYGSPLTATTHISLIQKCLKEGIKYEIFHNASILDAVAETGLQLYKFGKTVSMPKWDEKNKPKSFVGTIKFNQTIKAHTLILVDIGLTFPDALRQLGKAARGKGKLNKLIVCSQLGTKKKKIYYEKINDLFGAEVLEPFCIVIPSELHFLEKEVLEEVKEKI